MSTILAVFAQGSTSVGLEGLAVDALRQTPAVVALIIIVWYFLKHISDASIRQEKVKEKRAEVHISAPRPRTKQ
jgi:hypothetical protein